MSWGEMKDVIGDLQSTGGEGTNFLYKDDVVRAASNEVFQIVYTFRKSVDVPR